MVMQGVMPPFLGHQTGENDGKRLLWLEFALLFVDVGEKDLVYIPVRSVLDDEGCGEVKLFVMFSEAPRSRRAGADVEDLDGSA